MSAIDFNDPNIVNILSNFENFDKNEFEHAKFLDDEISSEDHAAFIEAIENLSAAIRSCVLGIFEARQNGNKIATIALLKMLSQLFLVGRQACENRLKLKWTKDGAKKIEKMIQIYENVCDAIQTEQPQAQSSGSKTALRKSVPKTANIKQEQPEINELIVKQENFDVIELSDDEILQPLKRKSSKPTATRSESLINDNDENVVPVKRKRIKQTASSALNSSTESCNNDNDTTTEVFPVIPEDNRFSQSCKIFRNVKVGYSDVGKNAILIVADSDDENTVYILRLLRQGLYRCSLCGLINIHRYAKLYQGIVYSNIHECKGRDRKVVEQEQRIRARKFHHQAKLPTLEELSSVDDPRPYPAYPKAYTMMRTKNPDCWSELIKYSNFKTCLTKSASLTGYVAYPDSDPGICYEYFPTSSTGSYRCTTCYTNRRNTIAKIDETKKILKSADHICSGLPIEEFEETQSQLRRKHSTTDSGSDDSD